MSSDQELEQLFSNRKHTHASYKTEDLFQLQAYNQNSSTISFVTSNVKDTLMVLSDSYLVLNYTVTIVLEF